MHTCIWLREAGGSVCACMRTHVHMRVCALACVGKRPCAMCHVPCAMCMGETSVCQGDVGYACICPRSPIPTRTPHGCVPGCSCGGQQQRRLLLGAAAGAEAGARAGGAVPRSAAPELRGLRVRKQVRASACARACVCVCVCVCACVCELVRICAYIFWRGEVHGKCVD